MPKFRAPCEMLGFVSVFTSMRNFQISLGDWKGLNYAIEQEHKWYMATDMYGGKLRIRVDDIDLVWENTPEKLAAQIVDEAAEEEHNKLHGGTT